MSDDFGVDRFDRHLYWRCSGRIDVTDDEAVEPDEPREFVVARASDRWLYTAADDALIAVGDATRDLVPQGGGLVRRPAGHGFEPYWTAGILRQSGNLSRQFVTDSGIVKQRDKSMAGRATRVLDLEHPSGSYYTLGIDVDSGIWVNLVTPIFSFTVDRLTLGAPQILDFYLLDAVPDVRWPEPEPTASVLAPVRHAIQELSSFQVEAVGQNERTMEFTFVLLEGTQLVGQVSRSRTLQLQSPAHFGGGQAWISDDEWEIHVDLARGDDRVASLILRDVARALPANRKAEHGAHKSC